MFTRVIISISLIFSLSALIFVLLGLKINTTNSIPKGIYIKTNTAVERGGLVIFCPNKSNVFKQAYRRHYIASGFCENGTAPLMKSVSAIKDDLVSINNKGVTVNNRIIDNSKPIAIDGAGNKLSAAIMDNHKLNNKELLLMGTNPLSFDSRYFGLINKNQIISSIKPIFTL